MKKLQSVFERYRSLSKWDKLHILIRIRSCPWDSMLMNMPSGETLIDIGCGHGLLINLLDMKGNRYKKMIGTDLSEDKIKIAKTSENDHVIFLATDFAELKECADVYSIYDVLYLVPYNEQKKILKNIYDKLSQKGYLVIKEVDTKPLIKFIWNYFEELIMVKILKKTLGAKFFFRSSKSFKAILENIGFKVKIVPLDMGYLHPHVMLICQKI